MPSLETSPLRFQPSCTPGSGRRGERKSTRIQGDIPRRAGILRQHRQLPPVEIGLVLLGEAGERVAVQARLRVGAKLADDDRLVVRGAPGESVALLRQPVVPADILVQAEHVEVGPQRIVDSLGVRSHRVMLQRRGQKPGRIGGAGVRHQRPQEARARLADRRLVPHRPEDHGGAVAVARDLLRQLRAGVGQRARVGPGDRPVDGDLRPDQQPQPIGGTGHLLVVRVVGQAHEVAAQLLGQAQQRLRVGARGGPPAASEGFLVQRDPAQENRTPIEVQLRPDRLDGPKADPIVDTVLAGRDGDVVELWRLGRPERRVRLEVEPGAARGVGREGDPLAELRDLHRHPGRPADAVDDDDGREVARIPLGALDPRVAHEDRRRLDEAHPARQPPVVPPVGVHRRQRVRPPRVVDHHHQRVAAGTQLPRHLEGERREATFVPTEPPTVQPHRRPLRRRAELHELPSARPRRRPVEPPLVPDGPLVVEQLRPLRVPVTGHIQRRRAREVVLDQLRLVLRRRVQEVSVRPRLVPIVERAVVVGIDDDVPGAVEALPGAPLDEPQRRRRGGGVGCPE